MAERYRRGASTSALVSRVRNRGHQSILAAFGEGSSWLQRQCAEKRLPQFGSLDAARTCPAELACVPSNNCSQWFSYTGRERKGRPWSRETCRWLASCAVNAVLALIRHLPQAVWEGKWRLRSNAHCLSFSWEQSQQRERLWQHPIQGADVRGNILIRKTPLLGFSKEPQRLSAHVLERICEGQGRNPGLPGSLLGLGKLSEGSSRPRGQALVQHLWVVQVTAVLGPICLGVAGKKGKATQCQIWSLVGAFRGVQLSSAWPRSPVARCQLLQAGAERGVLPDPACPLPSPLPKQGSATGFKQSWKLGTEARSRKEPSLLFCVWVGFCTAVGSTNMFPICLLH